MNVVLNASPSKSAMDLGLACLTYMEKRSFAKLRRGVGDVCGGGELKYLYIYFLHVGFL